MNIDVIFYASLIAGIVYVLFTVALGEITSAISHSAGDASTTLDGNIHGDSTGLSDNGSYADHSSMVDHAGADTSATHDGYTNHSTTVPQHDSMFHSDSSHHAGDVDAIQTESFNLFAKLGGLFLPWISPFMLSAFLTGFGGAGIVMRQLAHANENVSLGVGILGGFWFRFTLLFILRRIVSTSEGSSHMMVEEFIGKFGAIATPIPPNGMGSVHITSLGTLQSLPAKCINPLETEQGIPSGTSVRIARVEDGVAYVVRSTPGLPDDEQMQLHNQ